MNEIAIRDMGELSSVAQTVAKSGLFGAKTPEQAFVAIATGMELGLKPMQALRNIVVVQGRPTFSADGGFAVVRNHPEYGGIRWEKQDAQSAVCVITRISKGGQLKEEFTGSFSMKEAAAAGLANKDNWKGYPARMLRARALSYACRDAFPDVLNGLYTPDEISPDTPVQPMQQERAIRAEVTDSAPTALDAEAKADPEAVRDVKEAEAPALKGGPATPEETAEIKKLLAERYADGTPVFTREEKKLYMSYRRMDSKDLPPMTARELIDFLINSLMNRRGE